MPTKPQCIAIVLLSLPALAAAAQSGPREVTVGRYSTRPAEPSPEQRDPLSATVALRFPQQQVRKVGEAIDYVLQQSGYRLASAQASDPAMQVLLSRPLPGVQRRLGPCSLRHALTTLAGPVYRLVVDPLHRLVSFELTERYRPLATGYLPRQAFGDTTHRGPIRNAAYARPPRSDAVDVYGPTRPNDTLLPVALRLARDRAATPEQLLLAVWDANPAAFGRVGGSPNLNFLRLGVMLYAPPTGAWRRWTPAEARREVARQRTLWRRYVDDLRSEPGYELQ